MDNLLDPIQLFYNFLFVGSSLVLNNQTRKHSIRMCTDRAVTSSERVSISPIVNRITDACENITFPYGQ